MLVFVAPFTSCQHQVQSNEPCKKLGMLDVPRVQQTEVQADDWRFCAVRASTTRRLAPWFRDMCGLPGCTTQLVRCRIQLRVYRLMLRLSTQEVRHMSHRSPSPAIFFPDSVSSILAHLDSTMFLASAGIVLLPLEASGRLDAFSVRRPDTRDIA